jgi:hypothetical protein
MSMGFASVPIPRRLVDALGGGFGDALALRRAASCANSALHAEHRTRRLPMYVGGIWYSCGEAHLV